ncbi:MAG: PAS domain S-box protein [Roseivirga sp.]|nr:PAS domain S-box protein [Roseivirga sp.]
MARQHLKDDLIFPLIFENSVEGILVTNDKGKIIRTNPSCLSIFGYTPEEMLDQPVEMLIPINLRDRHIHNRENYAMNPESRPMASELEIMGLRKSGEKIPLEISLSHANSEIGALTICFIVDVSNKHSLKTALENERELIRQYLDVTKSIFLVLGKNEQIIAVNKQGSKLLGLPEDELKGKNWFDEFIPEAERESVRAVFIRMMNNEIGITHSNENSIIGSGGNRHLIEWHNTLLKDKFGQPEATLSSGVDITEKRALEREKTEALVLGQENERRRLAQELHDGLGQSISAIGLNLNALEPELKSFNDKFKKIYEEVKEKLNETVEEVRAISRNLTPKILDDFGLQKALEHLCDTIDKSTLVELNLNLYGDMSNVDKVQALGIYRIIQELVNNALRHADPKNVFVHVTRGESEWIVLVEDDGRGFDPVAKPKGMGLSNVRSRAELLKGEVHIDSNEKSGTTVSVNIPL